VGGGEGGEGAVGGGGVSLGNVTEDAYDWLGLNDSFAIGPQLGYHATSQPLWLSTYCVSGLY
jgi:hypothetical protein